MPTQEQMFYQAHKRLADANKFIMDLARDPSNPLTNNDLRKLVDRFPERWGRYRGLIGKLPH
ncbi:hypothetical protein [Acidihalobacter ferrooxydans]|uniref:Uncharacterized protein n=1 Tax=Acidihalobacter ferrooxydans TaxID=1765967 RepID=A0A1P8UFF2_9GAMM|nr:hypothetical protein [Acidihalobacter ferrooxydans]APZ42529.1 hypothetical protein BW247_05005 [Acidihalobacter ferrooxydans]